MSENKKPSLKNLGKKEKAIVAGLAALACCIPLGAVALNSQPDTSNENSEKNISQNSFQQRFRKGNQVNTLEKIQRKIMVG